ncbi:hypothetical protein D3Y59_04145 [Hymenobacter oligotrophus]|uniref:STAS/SEC14 domain-containing protein n=1 Tax=Hymenobacter oligotrophus TaxID=2319843 RepID=A0A3B7QYQ5_9BACT|nr:hypothetical protein [Hymenobacter oligotrophus]AYA36323.1 hypothetical protein D3Y59_04145 [Hymenobacter oligotrophus]
MPTSSSVPRLARELFANAGGRIAQAHPAYLLLEWLPGASQPEVVTAVFERLLLAMRLTGCRCVLTDQRQMPPLDAAVQRWVAEQWLPRAAAEAGYSHCAVLLSENVFARLGAVTWVSQYQPKAVVYQAFASPEAAAEWLVAR